MRSYIAIACAALVLAGCKEEGPPIDTAAAERGAEHVDGCLACHVLRSKNNKVGPHLGDIVGRQVASVGDYDYSDALNAQDFVWTPELMVAFILDPTAAYPGTKMAYGGIEEDQARDLVEYLRSLQR